jgi:type I site-specific restriction-modification system R (restriction) subunit
VSAPVRNTGKSDTFVLDFVNDTDEVERSFQPYYEQTTVSEAADPHQLYELQSKLDAEARQSKEVARSSEGRGWGTEGSRFFHS